MVAVVVVVVAVAAAVVAAAVAGTQDVERAALQSMELAPTHARARNVDGVLVSPRGSQLRGRARDT